MRVLLARRVGWAATGILACVATAGVAAAAGPVVKGPASNVRVSRVVQPPRLLQADQVGASAGEGYGGSLTHVVQVDPPALSAPGQTTPLLPGQPPVAPPNQALPSPPASGQPAPGPAPDVIGAPSDIAPFLPSDEEVSAPATREELDVPIAPTYVNTMLGRERGLTIWTFRPNFGPKVPPIPLKPSDFAAMPRSWPCSPCESYANPCLGIIPPEPVGLIPVLPYCPYFPPCPK